MSSLFWKICAFLLVNIQVIKTAEQPSDLLPNTTICGKSSRFDPYPWMVLIQYKTRIGIHEFNCGGSLINKRYILTTAHCIRGSTVTNLAILGVRLGEFNLDTDPDCIKTARGVQCASSPLNIEIEEEIVHEDYMPYHQDQPHDISLLRLKQEVEFTETIRPLCLPTTPEKQRKAYVGQRLTVAGWGRTETRINSSVKRGLKVPVQDLDACKSKYNQISSVLGEGQFCAGGEPGRGTCRGDGGNSLMVSDIDENAKVYWYGVGMVSFGPSPCGREDWPSVYTNISTYMPWILGKLRP